MTERGRDDRVLGYTKGLSLFIVPFLVVASAILYVFPGHTTRLWAWPIPVTMTSMMLASAYVGGVYFFLRVAWSRHWHELAFGFLAVTLFASLLGVATLMHWEKFSHDHISFWLWAGLYFTAPFLVLAAWLTNRRYAAPLLAVDDILRPLERGVIGTVGLVALAQGVVMFVAPSTMIDRWPWALTPLTARVVGAVFCLGGAALGAWRDPRWTSLRLMPQVEVLMVALMLVAAARARHEMLGGRPLGPVLLVGALAVLVGSAYLWVVHEVRPHRVAGLGAPGA